LQISCIQPDQSVTATLSYPLSYLILSLLAREGAIFVEILDIFEFFGDPKLRDLANL